MPRATVTGGFLFDAFSIILINILLSLVGHPLFQVHW